jgi:hypothetical protein
VHPRLDTVVAQSFAERCGVTDILITLQLVRHAVA